MKEKHILPGLQLVQLVHLCAGVSFTKGLESKWEPNAV